MTKEMIVEILKEIEANPDKYYGLRVDDCNYNIGDICNLSHELFQDPIYDDNDELVYPEGEGIYKGYYDAGELNGTCAVSVNEDCIESALEKANGYYGDYIYLIAGDYEQEGNDIGESIIEEAVVLKKWKV